MHVLQLPHLLRAAAYLAGSIKSDATQDLKSVLCSRLAQFYVELGRSETNIHDQELDAIQSQTAKEALFVVDAIQQIFSVSPGEVDLQDGPFEVTPALGTRDLSHIRTLLSIVFKWGTGPLLNRVILSWPSKHIARPQMKPQVIDLTNAPEDYKDLCRLTHQLLSFILPDGHRGLFSQTLIADTLLVRHTTDILKPCIALGWLPKSLSSDSMPTQDDLRPFVMRLLSMPPSQTITALGGVMSSSPPPPPHVQRSCAFLLGRQLVRPAGIRGLCSAVFGEEEGSEAEISLEKLEHISKVLNTVPPSMESQVYFEAIAHQLLALLSDDQDKPSPSHAYKRAVAFSLSRMLSEGSNNKAVVSNILLPILHDPILRGTAISDPGSCVSSSNENTKAVVTLTPSSSISTLQILLANIDPSPMLVSALFSSIVPSLYALYAYLDGTKTSDPTRKGVVRDLLETWARVVVTREVIEACWSIVNGEGGYWKSDIVGELRKMDSPENISPLALFTPEQLKRAEESGELGIDSNLLDLRPDPVHFVGFLKSINRSDVSADLFVQLLEQYHKMKTEDDADPLRTLLYLQLIIQIQSKLADNNVSSNILQRPEHILSFVKHSLETGSPNNPKPTVGGGPVRRQGLSLADLRIVTREDNALNSDDSDDETLEEEDTAPDEEMTITTINLLLSLLEANANLSAQNAPALNDIFLLLEALTKESTEPVRALAMEARMVLTARLASTSISQNTPFSRNKKRGDSLQTYQKALTLLQDPLLPVRAHGLMLLRQLAAPGSSSGDPLDPALVPGVLSIFLQSIQDEDSYIFLNAVQGLAAMVDGFGKEVLKGLMSDYASGLDGPAVFELTQSDLDVRLRIGEALGQVIKRCDEALPLYIDILAPPLARLVRMSSVPTTIRTSALSLLAQIAGTRAISLLPYVVDLFDGMIDLLQLEGVPATSHRIRSRPSPEGVEEQTERVPPASMDSQPTAANSKFPPLRRAALHFLTLLLQACITRVYDMGASGLMIPVSSIRRANTTLDYVRTVDEDAVVKVMAGETKEYLDSLCNTIMGF